jgi:hypothetical protein
MKEKEILQQAIRQFNAITGAVLQELPAKKPVNRADAAAELRFGKQKTRFWVEIKNEIREQNIHGIMNLVKQNPGEWLLVCRYIPKPVKEELKNKNINYLETAGNCFIQKDGLFFYINDKAVTKQRLPREGKLWKQAGLKFLFGILVKPELLNQPYRVIAAATNIALGNIGTFIEELKQEGFVKEGIKNKKKILFIENKEQLQNKWVELFNAVLKPKLKLGRFRFLNNNDWKNRKNLPATNICWGGEAAGELLTDFLQPEILTIYTRETKTTIMKNLRLVPDPEGKVELMELFWDTHLFENNKHKTVPPLLAYAELITSLDSRNRETAERIKQKYLG